MLVEYPLFFASGLVFDTLWVLCVHFVAKRRAHLAAVFGVMLSVLSGVTMASIAHDRMLLIPQVIGIFFGTYVGMYVAGRVEEMGRCEGRSDRSSPVDTTSAV